MKTYVGGLPHELGGVDFGPGGDNLGFTNSLLGSGGRERLLQLDREVDVFEEDRLDGHAPLLGGRLNLHVSPQYMRGDDWCWGRRTHNLGDFLGETFSVRDNRLEDSATDDLSKGGLCGQSAYSIMTAKRVRELTGSLDESGSDIVDTECGSVWRDDVPTDDTVDIDRDVVLGLDHLSRDTSELNLDVWR